MQKNNQITIGIQVMHHKFLDSEELQGTHWNTLNPFNSNLMTLNLRGGLRTFPTNLALCVPSRNVARSLDYFQVQNINYILLQLCIKKGLND
jgi:hypothetical protein